MQNKRYNLQLDCYFECWKARLTHESFFQLLPYLIKIDLYRFIGDALSVKKLSQRAALVTGGGRRIGAGIAKALAADGWCVYIHCHKSSDQAAEVLQEIKADSETMPPCENPPIIILLIS